MSYSEESDESDESDHSAVKTIATSSTPNPSPVYSTWLGPYHDEGSLSTVTEPFPDFDESCELAGVLKDCPQVQAYHDALQKTIEGIGRLSKCNEDVTHPYPLSSDLPYCCGTGERATSTTVPAVSSSPAQPFTPKRNPDTVVCCTLSFPGAPKPDGPRTPTYSLWRSTETVCNTAEAKQGCLNALENALNTLDVTSDVQQRIVLYTHSFIRMEEILHTQQNETGSCCCGFHSDIPVLAEPIITYLNQLNKRIRQQILAARNANAYIKGIYLDNTILPFQRFPKIVRYVFRDAPKHRREDLTILKRLQDLYEILISNTFFATWEHRHVSEGAMSSPACVEIYNTLAAIESTLQDTIDQYAEFIGINQDIQDRYITPLSRQVLGASITWELEQCRYRMES